MERGYDKLFKMITQIVIHLLPHEIDWFEWQAKQLKVGSYYIKDKVIIDITLNLNLINWEISQLSKQYFIDKFNQILEYFDWCEIISEVNEDKTCLGIDDKRRNSIRKYNPDNFIYLDCDIVFKPETLALLINSAKTINDEYYIISPQTPKLWDVTWDMLVNKLYQNEQYGFYKTVDPYSILIQDYGDIVLFPIDIFKFGGGWFNLISSKLLKFTDIPDSFGPYGIDDTYVMYCCEIMKQKQLNPQQYIVKNLVVAENHLYRVNPYADYLSTIDNKDEYRKQAENNLNIELNNFNNRYKNK
jgi:hypothetical protein